ncbi:hypothetical protein HOG17_04950 [Candidatus Peregrinibacteria bacterium]|jgi:hypothetical protein|nr:hypothetical protein [Candidatus Peregrinibacteria bacterium]MBT4148514.1 hypothetical protein [Candidatus Peregrinibacteria bacterium]MBT4366705.1 hypothetical protein [Candidatus Peregrinibacteria bacterium]MBT4455526.1 hypothetical protein [Candidatus Peregrinibacteria bacterium]
MNRYYYDYRRSSSRSNGPGGGVGLLFPFFLLIIIGIMLVLGFRLFYAYVITDAEDGVYLYIAEGQAQIKMWGTDEYVKAYNKTKILQGDEVYTSKDSKVVVEFEDGLVVRLGGETSVVFNEIYDDGNGAEVDVLVDSGAIWVNKTAVGASDTDLSVLTDNLLVFPDTGGAIFEIENRSGFEVVRTLFGGVNIDVYSQNGGTQVDHILVEERKEALFDADGMNRFWKFQAPNVVEDLSFDFEESPWYLWNVLEDEEPSDWKIEVEEEVVVEVVDPEVVEPEVVLEEEVVVEPEPEPEPELELEPEPAIVLGPLENPKVLKINGVEWDSSMFEEGLKVESETIKMEGSVKGATDVVVNNYNLQRFEPQEGEEDFVYWMSEEYENLVPGENVYEIYALDADGSRSGSVHFKVIWSPEIDEIPHVIDESDE